MPRYLMFIIHNEDYRNQPIPRALNDEMGQFVADHLKSGVLIDTNGLEPSSKAKCIRLSRGKLTVTDGPFTEAKEVIGGYALIQTPSRKDAIDLATAFMEIHRRHWPEFECTCELRPIDGEDEGSTATTSAAAPQASS